MSRRGPRFTTVLSRLCSCAVATAFHGEKRKLQHRTSLLRTSCRAGSAMGKAWMATCDSKVFAGKCEVSHCSSPRHCEALHCECCTCCAVEQRGLGSLVAFPHSKLNSELHQPGPPSLQTPGLEMLAAKPVRLQFKGPQAAQVPPLQGLGAPHRGAGGMSQVPVGGHQPASQSLSCCGTCCMRCRELIVLASDSSKQRGASRPALRSCSLGRRGRSRRRCWSSGAYMLDYARLRIVR
mmetsp:Transcript_46340/g.83790  ORF Transcript_46340/g.83790 Transcript_46340/m.83790 type:complete len:237 (-) Transcript_46340:1881-2591(-)